MSHNYPYRRSDKGSRPNSFKASDQLCTASDDYSYYSRPQEPSYSTMPSSSYSSSSRASMIETHQSQSHPDKALSLLSSCGLEPKDLALLAELPEHLITVESLPGLLMEIKNKRGKRSTSASSHQATARPPPANPTSKLRLSNEWEKICSQPVQYPLEHSYRDPKPQLLPPEQVASWQDRWGNPRQIGSIILKPSTSSSSSSMDPSYVVDYNFGKEENDISSYERPSYSVAPGRSSSSINSSSRRSAPISSNLEPDYRYTAPTRADYDQLERSKHEAFFTSRMKVVCKMPSRKAALDFHGDPPETYPYACSLCDITVLSEKVWISHVNGPQHADGQLTLLQMFPDWDCRMESINKYYDQPERPKAGGRTVPPPQRPSQSSGTGPGDGSRKKEKSQGNSKVLCAKFSSQAYNEGSLRRLTEQFGKVVKIITFPSLAFVEMGSNSQAKDLVKYYAGNPIVTEGKSITFYVSSTFNFLQSSKVLSFTPAPVGEEGYTDLMVIAKCFGTVLYSLFQPSAAFVEMNNALDAQKLVDYYSSSSLKIDDVSLRVAFSSEYSTLMNVPSVRKYEGSTATKRKIAQSPKRDPSHKRGKRSSSKDTEDSGHSGRQGERSEEKDSGRGEQRKRSEEKEDRGRGERRKRSEEKVTSRSSSKHGQSSSKSSHTTDTEQVSGPDKTAVKKTNSKPDEAAPSTSFHPQAKNNTKDQEDQSKTPASTVEPASHQKAHPPSTNDKAQPDTPDQRVPSDAEETKPDVIDKIAEGSCQEQASGSCDKDSDMDSDIEGMAVIGEDGDHLGDDSIEADMEDVCQEDVEQEEKLEAQREATPPEVSGTPEEKQQLQNTWKDEKGGEEEEMKGKPEQKSSSPTEMETEKVPTVDLPAATGSGQEPEPRNNDEDVKNTKKEDEEEEDPDFPESLENCITLDELDEEPSDEDKNKRDKFKSNYSRVIYIKNLPCGFYTDAEFVRILRGYGKVVRYFLICNRQAGFLEMSSSEEASKAAHELRSKQVEFNGARLFIQLSRKYHRLTTGWRVESESDKRKGHRTRSSHISTQTRSRSHSKPKTSVKNDTAKNTSEKENSTAKREDSPVKATENKGSLKRTKENEESVAENEDLTATTAAKIGDVRSVGSEERQQTEGSTTQEVEKKSEESVETVNKHSTSDPQTSDDIEQDSENPQALPCEKKSEARQEERAHTPPPDAVKTWVESFKPNNPVGMEFVRPVVGYFCNLCQVIYADEDKAKNEHCSSLSHFQKFMEHKLKDTTAS